MNIKVNGETKEVSAGLTLHQLLVNLEIDPARPGIAVAIDQEVILRTQWGERKFNRKAKSRLFGQRRVDRTSIRNEDVMEALEKGNHLIIWGDTLSALSSKIPDSSVDLIFADPPYNIGKNFNGRKDKWTSEKVYLEWCYRWIDLCLRKLKDTGSFYLMAATQNMPYFDIYLRIKSASFPYCLVLRQFGGPSQEVLRFSI